MQLLNLSFALLIIKLVICIVPGVVGISMIVSSEDKKRDLRNSICSKLFGSSNAIPYPKFARVMVVLGLILLMFSCVTSWFLLLQGVMK